MERERRGILNEQIERIVDLNSKIDDNILYAPK